MKDVLVSTIIPYYKGSRYLEEAILSVKNQTYKNIEIIVVNDSPQDNIETLKLQNLQKKYNFAVVHNKYNMGLTKALIIGVSKSKGKYIQLLSQDDLYIPKKTEIQMQYFKKNRSKHWVYGNMEIWKVNENTREVLDAKDTAERIKNKTVFPKIYNGLLPGLYMQASMFKKEFAEKTLFPVWNEFAADGMPTAITLLKDYSEKVGLLVEPLTIYRLHGENTVNNAFKMFSLQIPTIIGLYPKELQKEMIEKLLPLIGFNLAEENKLLKKVKRLFNRLGRKIKKIYNKRKGIQLFYSDYKNNFGDILSYVLMDTFNPKKIFKNQDPRSAEVCFIGSLLDVLFLDKGDKNVVKKPITVAGSGFIAPPGKSGLNKEEAFCRPINVLGLRGKISKERMEKILNKKLPDVVLGDPGLLASELLDTKGIIKKYAVGIIPHYVDENSDLLKNIRLENSLIIDIKAPTQKVLSDIASCEFILSSAMHGLIAADSLYIPNRRIIMSNKIIGDNYKFDDYYSVFKKKHPKPINLRKQNINEADIAKYKREYHISPEEIKTIQINLKKMIACL